MTTIEFTVPGDPIAQPRLRHDTLLSYVGPCRLCYGARIIAGRQCRGCGGLGIIVRKSAVRGTPMVKRGGKKARHPIHAYRQAVELAARNVYRGEPHDGPVRLDLFFWMPRPKRMIWKRKLMKREHHTSKPDIDNLVKGVADALSGIVYADDTQVNSIKAHKRICAGDEEPRTEVSITLL